MGRGMMRGLAAAVLMATPAAAAPSRIMSLNLCADELVLALAPPERIASVTYLARDCRISVACAAAARVPVNDGSAEEMVAAEPDLIVSGSATRRSTVRAAERVGFRVLDLDAPTTIEGVRAQLIDLARAMGTPERGLAMAAALDRDLAALPRPSPGARRPVAALLETGGFTVGRGSLIDALLERAGFDNLATRLGIGNYPALPLEELVSAQPDLLIVEARQDDPPSLGNALLDHRILKAGFPADRQIAVPQRLWLCGGPAIVDALRLLTAARARIEANPS